MESTTPSTMRRLLLPLALMIPLVVDPYGVDTLSLERLLLACVGLALLGLESAEVLFGKRASLVLATPEALLLALVAWAATSMLWATNRHAALGPLLVLLGMLGIARTVRATVTGAGSARNWVMALLGTGLVAMGIDTLAIRNRAPEMGAGADKYASLLFEHNNMAANYAVLLVPLAAVLLLEGGGKRRGFGLVSLLASIAYIIMVGSRAAIIAMILALPLMLIAFMLRRWLTRLKLTGRVAGLGLGMVILIMAVLPFSDPARGLAKDVFYAATRQLEEQNITTLQGSSFRTDVFTKTVEMASENPMRGVGYANWTVEYPRFERHIKDRPHAHNDALQILAELGVPGLLLFLGLLASLGLTLLRVITTARTSGAFALSVGLMGTLLVFCVTGFFEVPFTIGATCSVLAFVIGLTTRLGETGGRAAGSMRPSPVVSILIIAVVLAGLWHVVQRLPASALVARAAERLESGDLDGAAEAMESVTRMHTGSWVPVRQLGQIELDRGRDAEALQCFESALELSPYKVELLRDKGEALMELGRFDDAILCFQQAREQSPGDEIAEAALMLAYDKSGRLKDAIDLLEYQLQSKIRTIDIDTVLRLAQLWRKRAETTEGEEHIEALAAARHFFAIVLEDGDASLWPSVSKEFKHMTHLLQVMPGSPDSWWPVYERFIQSGGWHFPNTVLWTAVDDDGVRIYPGWEEYAGPAQPRDMRDQP